MGRLLKAKGIRLADKFPGFSVPTVDGTNTYLVMGEILLDILKTASIIQI